MHKSFVKKTLIPGFFLLALSLGLLMPLAVFTDYQEISAQDSGWQFDWLISNSYAQEELLGDELLIDDLSEDDLLEDALLDDDLLLLRYYCLEPLKKPTQK
jgi:hypothetical protein